MKSFVVDIDGTIIYSHLETVGVVDLGYEILGFNHKLIKKLNRLYDEGNTIVLHTGRHWNHLQLTISQLTKAGIKYHSLVLGKPVGDYYIDDKGILPEKFLELVNNEL